MISPPTAFASSIERAVFPTAVGLVRMIRGCFTDVMVSPLYNALKFLFQFVTAHGDDGGASMRAGIGIVQL